MKHVLFVTGIDTNIGKSYATGYIAKKFALEGKKVITQKFIQTGNTDISEDIKIHRKIMGKRLLPEDLNGTTCPITLSYPASPHLAARIGEVYIDIEKIKTSTAKLKRKYDIVLIEGAGGIMTPVSTDYTTLDYIKSQNIPVIVVTSSRLGSINHTLLTLEICQSNDIDVFAVAYNKFNVENTVICEDTEKYLKGYLEENLPETVWIDIEDGEINVYSFK
ncbi:MAG: dethiobiotin synthase [Prevotellaceae bacterium]|jgi:dethiobiotin synthetase|nr:dethiobiotin synthase [Prevotellaceae bacterium]